MLTDTAIACCVVPGGFGSVFSRALQRVSGGPLPRIVVGTSGGDTGMDFVMIEEAHAAALEWLRSGAGCPVVAVLGLIACCASDLTTLRDTVAASDNWDRALRLWHQWRGEGLPPGDREFPLPQAFRATALRADGLSTPSANDIARAAGAGTWRRWHWEVNMTQWQLEVVSIWLSSQVLTGLPLTAGWVASSRGTGGRRAFWPNEYDAGAHGELQLRPTVCFGLVEMVRAAIILPSCHPAILPSLHPTSYPVLLPCASLAGTRLYSAQSSSCRNGCYGLGRLLCNHIAPAPRAGQAKALGFDPAAHVMIDPMAGSGAIPARVLADGGCMAIAADLNRAPLRQCGAMRRQARARSGPRDRLGAAELPSALPTTFIASLLGSRVEFEASCRLSDDMRWDLERAAFEKAQRFWAAGGVSRSAKALQAPTVLTSSAVAPTAASPHRANSAAAPESHMELIRWDVTSLPLRDASVDAIITDVRPDARTRAPPHTSPASP